MIKGIKRVILAVIILASALIVANCVKSRKVEAVTNIEINEGSVQIEEGDFFVRSVAIRLKDEKNENGVRFKSVIKAEKYEEILKAKGRSEVEIGLILMPYYKLDGELKITSKDATVQATDKLLSDVEYDGIKYKESIIYVYEIPEEHRTDEIIVRGYIKVDGEVKYYTGTKQVSMAEIAYREIEALEDGSSPLPSGDKGKDYYIKYITDNYLTYKVNYYDGETKIGEAELKYKESVGDIETPTKKGYTFSKYYTDKNLTQEFDASNTNSLNKGNIDLYAGFSVNSYNVMLPVIQNGRMFLKYGNSVIKSSSASQSVAIPYGTTVNMQAFTSDGESVFSSYIVDGKNLDENVFVMPDKNLTVSAEFKSTAKNITYSTVGCTTTGVESCGTGNNVKASFKVNDGYNLQYVSINEGIIAYSLNGSGQNYELNFTMPNTDVTVKISCVLPSVNEITVNKAEKFLAVTSSEYTAEYDYRVKNLDMPNYYACLDWAYFENTNFTERKKNKKAELIGSLSGAEANFYDYYFPINWSDGTSSATARDKINGVISTNTFSLPISVHHGVKRIRFYGGTWSSAEKVSLKDANGNLISGKSVEILATDGLKIEGNTITYEKGSGTHNASFVEFLIDVPTTQTVYLTAEKTLDTGNITLVAVAVFGTDQWADSLAYVNDTLVNLDDSLNGAKPLYWERYVGVSGENDYTCTPTVVKGGIDKNGFSNPISLKERNDIVAFNSYNWKLYGVSGGLENNNFAQTSGVFTSSTIIYKIVVPANVTAVKVFTGAWQSTNVLSLKGDDNVVVTAEDFTAPTGASGWARFTVFSLRESVSEKTYELSLSAFRNMTVNGDGEESPVDAFNVTLCGIVFYGQPAVTVSATSAPSSFSPDSLANVLDWQHFIYNDDKVYNEKLNSQKYILFNTLNELSCTAQSNFFFDYDTTFNYTDYKSGAISSQTGIHNTIEDTIIAIKVNSLVKHIYLFTGAYGTESANLNAKIAVYKNGVEAGSYQFKGTQPANCKLIDIGVNENEEGIIYIKISALTYVVGQSCNISLPMVVVSG